MSKKVNGCVKGKVFERAVVNWAKANGFPDMERTAQHCGKSGDAADVRARVRLPDLHIECKNVKGMGVGTSKLEEAIAQAESDCPNGKTPVVIWRKPGSGMMLSFEQHWVHGHFLPEAILTTELTEHVLTWIGKNGMRKGDEQ